MKDKSKKETPKFPLKEQLSQRELEELMGIFQPTYKREHGKIKRK